MVKQGVGPSIESTSTYKSIKKPSNLRVHTQFEIVEELGIGFSIHNPFCITA